MNPLNNINPNKRINNPNINQSSKNKVSKKFNSILGEAVGKTKSTQITKNAVLYKIKEGLVRNLMNSLKSIQAKLKEALDS